MFVYVKMYTKNGKSSGSDDLPAELIECVSNKTETILFHYITSPKKEKPAQTSIPRDVLDALCQKSL